MNVNFGNILYCFAYGVFLKKFFRNIVLGKIITECYNALICVSFQPPGSGTRLPEALCVVSIIGDSAFYGRLLDAVKESRFTAMKYAEEMLQMAYAKPFPQPDHEVYLRTVVSLRLISQSM